MNSFQRKSLYAALAGAGALGMTATADAVQVNPNGLGQVLIYPYYTVNADAAGNAYNSLLSVVNTDASAKVVKVRFLEGRRSQEVLDFNLFLSKFDVWTAGIVPSSSGGAKVITNDKSCTIPESKTTLQLGVNFVNFAYTGDGGGDGLDRTKEGYVEIIEMASYTSANCTSIVVTHVNGVPECQGAKHPLNDNSAKTDASSSAGGLFGGMTLINVGSGTDYTEDAVALERFNQAGSGTLYFNAGVNDPALDRVDPGEGSNVFNGLGYRGGRSSGVTSFNSDGTIADSTNWLVDGDSGIYTSFWDGTQCNATGVVATDSCLPVDAVSAVLMHSQVMNEFVLDAVTHSGTDWVITFPTKRFYVAVGTGPAKKLFQKNFNKTDFSCDDVIINIFDREENTITTPQSFSPPQPGGKPTSLCFEANVLTFNGSNVLGSSNKASLTTGFANGWLDMHLSSATSASYHKLVNTLTYHAFNAVSAGSTSSLTYQGLPVVGFAVQSFTNGTLVVGGVNVLANYGGNFVHKYVTLIN
jgi:hypothetical protein